jgi:glycine cleavage system H protein
VGAARRAPFEAGRGEAFPRGMSGVADYDVPESNRYSEDDEWVRAEGDRHLIGITDYAQQQLGDIVFVELPRVGTVLTAGEVFGVIESVKAVSDLFSPISGEVIEVNEALQDAPESINEDCYGDGWIIAVAVSNPEEMDDLMDADAYQSFLEDRET